MVKCMVVCLVIPGGGDPWVICAEERAKHDAQFLQLNPIAGILTGMSCQNNKHIKVRTRVLLSSFLVTWICAMVQSCTLSG